MNGIRKIKCIMPMCFRLVQPGSQRWRLKNAKMTTLSMVADRILSVWVNFSLPGKTIQFRNIFQERK
jgi:hypothetical protein